MDNTDVVWKISSNGKWGSHECLRYSIRSVVKNFKDLGKIVIVGTKPDWIQNIHFIPCDDPYKKNKDVNITNKLILAASQDWITPDFVNISDDQLIIHPINSSFLRPFTIDSDLRRMTNSKKTSKYGLRVKNTINVLKSHGLPTHCYECHVPMLLNKEKYIEALSKFDYTKGVGLCGNTIFFNYLGDNGEQPVENVRAFIRKGLPMSKIITECRGKLFLGYQRRALNNNLKNYLKQRFPEKSIYEK